VVGLDFKNGAFLYIGGVLIILFVLAQSVWFLVRAVRRGRELGISPKVMRAAAVSSGTFSIVPSVPIVLAMIALAATIGTPLSWIRLSVIGSMSYETIAAGKVLEVAGGDMTLSIFASVMWVMTVGIIAGPLFNIFGFKRYKRKLAEVGQKDPAWSNTLTDALFMGIIAVMGGQFVAKGIVAIANLGDKTVASDGAVSYGHAAYAKLATGGEAQLLTLITGVVLMLVFGAVIKLTKAKWLENFALPVSMVGAILLSIVYHNMFAGVM
jgi:hypothetical protein